MKILFVDDDILTQKMVTLMLSQRRYEVATASNGQEAVDSIKAGNFDLVLMDIQMPILDGIEASRQIRALEDGKAHVPIVALTASGMLAKVREYLEAGMDDFVSKPFSAQQLFHVIDSLTKESSRSFSSDSVLEEDDDGDLPLLDARMALPNFGSSVDHYTELLNEFLASLSDKIGLLKTNIETGDLDSASRIAHNLKGVSGSFGAMQLSIVAAQLDDYCKNGNFEMAQELFQKLKQGVKSLCEYAPNVIEELVNLG